METTYNVRRLQIIGLIRKDPIRSIYLCTDADNFYIIHSDSKEANDLIIQNNTKTGETKTLGELANNPMNTDEWPDPQCED